MDCASHWQRVSHSHPCPICGKPDWCLVSGDGNAAICPRIDQGSIKNLGAAGYLHLLNDQYQYSPQLISSSPSLPPLPKTPKKRSTAELTRELESYQHYAERGRILLQEQLGLDPTVLQRLEVGYCPLQKTWFFPERDADKNVIGIQRRLHNHAKRRLKGSSAGLTYSNDWDTGRGPLLLVEGGSDVAAGMMLGISVIGRPSNRGGCALLGKMLQLFQEERDIIVLGERDQKESGLWPGKEGAIHTATELAKRLLRPVQWALPPDNAKDLRAWVNEYANDSPLFMSEQFLNGLQRQPVLPPPIQRLQEECTTILSEQDYRQQMLTIRQRSLDQPGIYLDRSGTGHGKSTVDFQMIQYDLNNQDFPSKYLLVYPTHKNLAEELDHYEQAGLDVAIYPARTTVETEQQLANCWNQDADRAEAIGFSVGKTICCRCSEQKRCHTEGYLQQILQANEASVALATHARVEHTSFEELADERDYIAVHEDPVQLLNPTVSLSETDLQVAQLHLNELLSDPFWLNWFGESTSQDADGNTYDDNQKKIERERYFNTTQTLTDLVDELQQVILQTQETIIWRPPKTLKLPSGYESFLWWTIKFKQRVFQGSPWRCLLLAVQGELNEATIIVTQQHVSQFPQGTIQHRKSLFGVLNNHPPSVKTVWLNDATLTKDRLEGILNRSVRDGTPHGRIAEKKFAMQYVRDVTRKTSLDVLVSLIRGVLAKHAQYKRVGVMTHRPQLKAIERLEQLFRQRIVMSTYYGSGDERSSNAWYRECDLILVLGTPRVPPQTVKEYLIQVSLQHDACREPPWGEIQWQARTHQGKVKVYPGRGYHEQHWRDAHRDLVRATLLQAIGRARLILEEGADVIVLSNEECGIMVIDDETPRLNDPAMEVYEQIQKLTAIKPNKGIIEKVAVSSQKIAKSLDRPIRTIRRLLTELESFHLVQRAGPRSGWRLCSSRSPVEIKSNTSSPDSNTEIAHVPCH